LASMTYNALKLLSKARQESGLLTKQLIKPKRKSLSDREFLARQLRRYAKGL